jgi:hypothetical protein
MRNEWRLTRAGEVLAVLRRPDGPWLHADYPAIEVTFQTTPEFEKVRHLFEREVALLEIDDDPEASEWLNIWEELQAPGLFVESANGWERVDVLWIHFQGDRAWYMPLYHSPRTVLPESAS